MSEYRCIKKELIDHAQHFEVNKRIFQLLDADLRTHIRYNELGIQIFDRLSASDIRMQVLRESDDE